MKKGQLCFFKNGEILQIGSFKPKWLEELMEYMI